MDGDKRVDNGTVGREWNPAQETQTGDEAAEGNERERTKTSKKAGQQESSQQHESTPAL